MPVIATLPPDDTTSLLTVLSDKSTSAEHIAKLRELSESIKKNLEETRALTLRNETALKSAEEAKSFAISVATSAKAEAEKAIIKSEADIKLKTTDLEAREKAVTLKEQSLDQREQTLKAQSTDFSNYHIEATSALSSKEAYFAEGLNKLKEDRYVVSQLQTVLEQKLAKLKEIAG